MALLLDYRKSEHRAKGMKGLTIFKECSYVNCSKS